MTIIDLDNIISYYNYNLPLDELGEESHNDLFLAVVCPGDANFVTSGDV